MISPSSRSHVECPHQHPSFAVMVIVVMVMVVMSSHWFWLTLRNARLQWEIPDFSEDPVLKRQCFHQGKYPKSCQTTCTAYIVLQHAYLHTLDKKRCALVKILQSLAWKDVYEPGGPQFVRCLVAPFNRSGLGTLYKD